MMKKRIINGKIHIDMLDFLKNRKNTLQNKGASEREIKKDLQNVIEEVQKEEIGSAWIPEDLIERVLQRV